MPDEEMATSPAEFWERRHDLSPSTAIDGTEGYRVVLLIDITDPEVVAAGEHVTETLDQFACFDPVPHEALHLTVKLFDISVPAGTTQVGDLPPDRRRVDEIVSRVATTVDPFEAEITRFNLFPDVVYGEVDADDHLADLNQAVCDHPEIAPLDRDGAAFIPHLTLGYFTGQAQYQALLDFLETNRGLQWPTIRVDELSLVTYEVGGRPPTYNRLATYSL